MVYVESLIMGERTDKALHERLPLLKSKSTLPVIFLLLLKVSIIEKSILPSMIFASICTLPTLSFPALISVKGKYISDESYPNKCILKAVPL